MQRFILVFSIFLSLCSAIRAQDKHFTQFYAAPLALNPALTGAFEGRYRVSTIYRDQWRKVLENPIKTYALAADLRFDASRRKNTEDGIGIGLMFFNDKVSVVDFSTTQVALSVAYHKSLGTNNRQFLSLGVQGGLTQRNVNYESLTFQDQFNGFTGYDGATREDLPTNNFSYTDYNVGLNYTAQIGKNGRFFIGAALHHFTQPRVAFFEDTEKGGKLFTKASAQVAASLPFDKRNRVSMQPRLLVASQGPHLEINTGTNFRFALGEYGSSALHVGTWVRPVKNSDGMGLDAAVVLMGFEINNVLFGLSYDLNLRALQANQRQAAFEFSVAYLGSYDNEDIICPKF
jgi:type IX secretion system PorP/SprF family membrane protein